MQPAEEAMTKEPEGFEDALEVLRTDPTRKRRRRAPRRLLLVAGLLAVVAVLGVSRLWKDPLAVEVARAVRLDPSAPTTLLTAGGYIVPYQKIELSPKITGRIEWIGAERGDQVKKGQVLIRLDQQELKAQMEAARSNLEAVEARLKELLAGSREEEIEQAQANVEEAQANLVNAGLNLKRMQGLFQEGAIARQLLDDAQNQYETANAKVKAVRERLRLLKAGPRREQMEAARAEVNQARANLDFTVANLENSLIRAPIDGTVLERLAEVGETVTTSIVSTRGAKSAILSLADLRDLQVEVDVNQNDLKKLRLKMPATVIPEAYPDRTYQGVLAEMAPEVNRQKATLQVKIQILKPDQFTRPGMNARVLFQEPPKNPRGAPRVLVPREAVVSRGEARLVYVILDGKAVERRVTLGGESGGRVAVLEGLVGGEMVVIRGATALKDGQAVQTNR